MLTRRSILYVHEIVDVSTFTAFAVSISALPMTTPRGKLAPVRTGPDEMEFLNSTWLSFTYDRKSQIESQSEV